MEEEQDLINNNSNNEPDNNFSAPIENQETQSTKKCKNNRNCNFLWQLILSILVIALIILQFVPIKKSPKSTIATATTGKIAHINVDTIMSKYPLVDTLQNRLQRQITTLETDLMNKQNSLQKNMQAYQNDMQNGKIITKDEANRREQQLMNEQQQLVTLRDQYDAQIQQLQMSMQTEILDSIKSAVKNLLPDKSFDYVLGYSNEGAIFYANPSLDITNDVLTVLNKRLKK